MLTKERIDTFYVDVEALKLRFPVAQISRATKESKGNVSRILQRKLEPSESFLDRFYNSFKMVPHETPPTSPVLEPGPEKITLQDHINTIKEHNRYLQEQNKLLAGQVSLKIEQVQEILLGYGLQNQARQETMLRALAELRKLHRDALIKESDNLAIEKLAGVVETGKEVHART